MKKLILLLPVFLLFSCSVQKRKYQNGYYVEWHHKKSHTEQSLTAQKEPTKNPKKELNEKVIEITTGDRNDALLDASGINAGISKKHSFFKKSGVDTCDIIVFKDGSEISAKVSEVGINEVRYKRCDSQDGPIYVSKKSEIFMIKYANGSKEIIKSETAVAPQFQSTPTPYKSNKYNRVNHPLSLPALVLGSAGVLSAYLIFLYALDSSLESDAVLFLPFVLGIVATILGAVSLGQIKSQPDVYKGKGMSIPGMIMGIVIASIMLLIIMAIFLF